jgi:hypothetical protein
LGSSIDEPKHEGEPNMVSRLPADSSDVDTWLDGEIPALCSDLTGDRNFTRVLLRWGAIRQRASKRKIRAAANRFDAENLLAGLHHAVQSALEAGSLTTLDGELGDLADAWMPGDSARQACRSVFSPHGVAAGPEGVLVHAAELLCQWRETGDIECLHDAVNWIDGYGWNGPGFPTEEQILEETVRALRATPPLEGGRVASALADALVAGDSIGVDWQTLEDDILDQVWAR